jgi:hypothetical protein
MWKLKTKHQCGYAKLLNKITGFDEIKLAEYNNIRVNIEIRRQHTMEKLNNSKTYGWKSR